MPDESVRATTKGSDHPCGIAERLNVAAIKVKYCRAKSPTKWQQVPMKCVTPRARCGSSMANERGWQNASPMGAHRYRHSPASGNGFEISGFETQKNFRPVSISSYAFTVGSLFRAG